MARDSFTERMEQGKLLAQIARNNGRHTGKVAKGWNFKRQPLTGLDAIEAYYQQWRKDIHYQAYAAVEWALFGHDWQDLAEF